MRTDYDFDGRYLAAPTVFRPDFNDFGPLSATQAWSMLLTFSQQDSALGTNPELGWFFNNLLLATVFTGVVGSLIYFGAFF